MATMYYRPYTTEPIRDGELPPGDAMDRVLPEYQYIFDPEATAPSDAARVPPDPRDPRKPVTDFPTREPGQADVLPVADQTAAAPIRGTVPQQTRAAAQTLGRLPDDLDRGTMNLLDYQMKELDQYRTAVQKMGQDIMTLRQQIREQEIENSALRRELSHYNDTTKLLMDNQELNSLTKPDLAARYTALKQKLTQQTTELRNYKDKVQKLQNDLIKKNDIAHEHVKITQAHGSQQKVLQRLQEKVAKVKKLEDTCRDQEKIIQKMERALAQTRKTKNGDTLAIHKEAHDTLLQENKRLRTELEETRDQTSTSEDLEKLELYGLLDKAEARIGALEKQLSDNARQWGRERADLGVKLNEASHGLGRSSQMVLHDFPSSGSEYDYSDRRPRLSPLRR